jgi:hypothetical protein
MLFVGGHGDVGGGFPLSNDEAALSDGTLKWMMGELEALGVRFSGSPVFIPKPDPLGPAHSPWDHLPWDVLATAARAFPAGMYLSQSVLDRIAGGDVVADFGFGASAPYGPQNLASSLLDRSPPPASWWSHKAGGSSDVRHDQRRRSLHEGDVVSRFRRRGLKELHLKGNYSPLCDGLTRV